jgi:hypothetical protein
MSLTSTPLFQFGFTTAEEGMNLIEKYYPRRELEPRIQFLLEEMSRPRHK